MVATDFCRFCLGAALGILGIDFGASNNAIGVSFLRVSDFTISRGSNTCFSLYQRRALPQEGLEPAVVLPASFYSVCTNQFRVVFTAREHNLSLPSTYPTYEVGDVDGSRAVGATDCFAKNVVQAKRRFLVLSGVR